MRPQAATRDITLDKKTKELIALALGGGLLTVMAASAFMSPPLSSWE